MEGTEEKRVSDEVSEKVEAVRKAVEDLALCFGAGAKAINFRLVPREEQKCSRVSSYSETLFSKKAAMDVKEKAIKVGFRERWDGELLDYRYLSIGEQKGLDDVAFEINYKGDKEDECAELKRKLRELECELECEDC